MERETLRQVLLDQKEYQLPSPWFPREYADLVRRVAKDPSILILSGVRRCGKSTLQRKIQKEIAPSWYYCNFDDDRLVSFRLEDFSLLLEVFLEVFGKQPVFFFDEIQNIAGWERFIRRLYDGGNKIYITGSNARLLSQELGTHLTGRYIQVEVFPLSFKEYVMEKEMPLSPPFSLKEKGMLQHHFSSYLHLGGIPDFVRFQNIEYLQALLEGIVYKDIAARYKIHEIRALREVVYYFASNVGKEFSYTAVSRTVLLGSPHTVSQYCHYLEQSYLFFFVGRYDFSLQKQAHSNKKCYMIDTALARVVGFRSSEDRGRLLENVVFLQLRRKTKEIYFHREKKECDFLVREGNRVVRAIQVTQSLSRVEVRKREVEGLLEAMHLYGLQEGWILTEHEEEEMEELSIHIVPIWKWCLLS